MKLIDIKKLYKSKASGNYIILIASIVLVYLSVSIYFASHFFFNTVINGVDLSLTAHKDADTIMRNYIKAYKLKLIERNGETDEIKGQDIDLQYNEKNTISKNYHRKNSLLWISSLIKNERYYIDNVFVYNQDKLEGKINKLNCLNNKVIEPQNVSFKYSNGSYEVVKEVYGNKINKSKLNEAIKMSLIAGETELDLNEKLCYEDPKFTLSSDKIPGALNLLNKYVSAKITYIFGSKRETLDGNIINKCLCVDENLEVIISEAAVMEYVRVLSRKYDTVGIERNFETSTGKIVEVKGGLYGWKINQAAEAKALIENIKLGEVLEKEPLYTQKTLSRDGDEIGNTYVEVNITRQYLWFYKDGKLITQGPVITGDINKGNSTALGVYMLNYKQRNAVLKGPGYETLVYYWMPFFGNMGIHDAYWRYSFGREIYKYNGTHGCVNTPLYVAKIIYENIEEGTPIICYEE